MHIMLKACAALAAAGMVTLGLGTPLGPGIGGDDSLPVNAAVRQTTAKQTADAAIPQEKLPQKVAAQIPDDAMVLSKDLAVTPTGEVKNVQTGKSVTDPRVTGTPNKPADPLAKTKGESFIPVPAKEVKQQVSRNEQSSSARLSQGGAEHQTYTAALNNNDYGAYWGSYNGTQAFFEAGGNLFAQQARGLVDVSQWQGDIDWQAARNAGVEGAIIRIGYGWGNGPDIKAQRNINECKRLGIPFGIYLYSYAYDNGTAAMEGDGTVGLLRQAGVQPGDLSFPVYYDLEHWAWSGHTPPTDPWTYNGMVDTWFSKLQGAGYNRLSVYSYQYYLETALNTGNIHSKTHWVASYGPRPGFSYPANERCWQYTSSGHVNGINGFVDMNAYGNRNYAGGPTVQGSKYTQIGEGDYFIGSAYWDRYLDIDNRSTQDSAAALIWVPTDAPNQMFHIKPVGDGNYTITSSNSGKALDVAFASLNNGTPIIQYSSNGGINQKWSFYQGPDGYLYIASAMGDSRSKFLDIHGAVDTPGTRANLWEYTGGTNQQFRLLQKFYPTGQAHYISSPFANGRRLDVQNLGMAPETPVEIWDPNGGRNQQFVFVDAGNAKYALRAVHSGQVLDIQGAFMGDSGNIIQFPWVSGSNQQWYIQSDGSNRFAIRSVANNKALDIAWRNTNAGARVISYEYHAQDNQKWQIN
ncbi:hypothetical protein KIM372_15300 [Bombiscardovia nodaiensis]|uniref:Ricin B lectin domain-containing protein n=1 Tax=Bombiscardovia nodaiensis TaxID=2932181 RepID=A0ABM8BA39_9BIFI|nr:hypothetical protein KIM372_15300 [Bombiscardovia nodaiensis]